MGRGDIIRSAPRQRRRRRARQSTEWGEPSRTSGGRKTLASSIAFKGEGAQPIKSFFVQPGRPTTSTLAGRLMPKHLSLPNHYCPTAAGSRIQGMSTPFMVGHVYISSPKHAGGSTWGIFMS